MCNFPFYNSLQTEFEKEIVFTKIVAHAVLYHVVFKKTEKKFISKLPMAILLVGAQNDSVGAWTILKGLLPLCI